MSNPFDPPQGDATPQAIGAGTGVMNVQLAFEQGLDAFTRNWIAWLVAMLVVGFVGGLSILMCVIPAFVVLPALWWGYTRFTLDTLDGTAEVGTVFKPFERLGEVVLPMLILIVLQFLVSLPGQVVSQVISSIAGLSEDMMVMGLGMLVGIAVSMLWALVIVTRFQLAPFLLVEQQMTPVDAFTTSWTLTGPVWGQIILFNVLGSILTIVGLMLCIVGVIPAGVIFGAAVAAVYRQLAGRGAIRYTPGVAAE